MGTSHAAAAVSRRVPVYEGLFKIWVTLKQQFTIEKGYYDPLYRTPYSEPDGLRIAIIAQCSSTAQNYRAISN
jgi:hypothetical protein